MFIMDIKQVLQVTGFFSALGIVSNLYIILCLVLPREGSGGEQVTRAINFTIFTTSCMNTLCCTMGFLLVYLLTGLQDGDHSTYRVVLYVLAGSTFSIICLKPQLYLLYWARIVPVRHAVLRWVKDTLPPVACYLIPTSLLTCFSLSTFVLEFQLNFYNTSLYQLEEPFFSKLSADSYVTICVGGTLMVLIPLVVMVACTLPILLHLSRHVARQSESRRVLSSPNLVQQVRVIRMLLFQLLFYVICACIIFSVITLEVTYKHSTLRLWLGPSPCMYSYLAALNIITGNATLRKTTSRLFGNLNILKSADCKCKATTMTAK